MNDHMENSFKLRDLQDQMSDPLDEMEQVVRGTGAASRAESYWLAHIKTALFSETQYLGGSMVTCDDTITELREEENPQNPKFDIDDDVLVDSISGVVIDIDVDEHDRHNKTFSYQVDFGDDIEDWFDEDRISSNKAA